MLDRWITFVPVLCYLLAAGFAALDLVRRRAWARFTALLLVLAGLVLRVVTFMEPGLCPVDVAGGGLGIVAMMIGFIVLVSAFAGNREPARLLFMALLIATLDVVGQSVATHAEAFHPPPKERALGELHGGLVLLAYAAFLVGAMYSVLYLVMYSMMKRRRLGFWFHRLPSLQQLEKRSRSAGSVGLALLTVGLLIGFYSFWVFRGGLPWAEVKFVVAMLLWALFAVELVLRRVLRWHGIRVMWIPALGALVLLLTYSIGGGHPFWSAGS